MPVEHTADSESTRRAVAGLGLMAVALALRAGFGCTNSALHAWLLASLRDGGDSGPAGLLGPLSQVLYLGVMVAGVMLVVGVHALGGIGSGLARRQARLAFQAFLIGLALDLLQYLFSLALQAGLELDPQVLRWIFTGLSGLGLIADCAAWVLFFLTASALYAGLPGGDATGRLALAAGATALYLLHWLVLMVIPALGGLLHEHPWAQLGLRAALSLAQAGAVIWLVLDLKKLLPLAWPDGAGAAGPQVDLGSQAGRVVEGLRAYRAWLLVKLVVLLLGYGLVLALAFGEARESAGGVLFGVAILGLVPAFGMLWGLWQYLGVPEESGARAGARAALVVALLGLLADGIGLWLAARLLGADYAAARQAQELSPWFTGATQVLGLVGLLCLLSSFQKLACHLHADALERRAGALMGLAVILVVAALGLRVGLQAGGLPLQLGLVLVGAALIAVIALVVMFVQLLGRLAAAAEAATQPSGQPATPGADPVPPVRTL
ncbi:MAG TPA: hypothetical protein PK668_00360 [Myxococcota bacterium]|nr:hypothetical protein [Myxococcota bacterium]HRY95717.1 hypothetical protein [Myxococcota bacterium]HSA21032.1 hypothetical protein [Myxococcota bacterium]